ncbi:alpha/beta fold hydrolase [Streptomyces sp. SID8358]|uniref:alpha/beta fold hydrolase n=1 Tax=Streptomyces sp. SID8358 TaxID=2690342 RepID=UPI000DB7FCFF
MARAGLTTEHVVRAAAEPADTVGFDHVTLSAPACGFGVRDAGLHSHVKNRGDLRTRLALPAGEECADRVGTAVAGRAGKGEPDLADAVRLLPSTFHGFGSLEALGGFDAPAMWRRPGDRRSRPCTPPCGTGPRGPRRARNTRKARTMTEQPTKVRPGTLEVTGATLHYEVRGSGPVLVLMPGGSADAGLYDVLAEELADAWTVVSYDPRCYSRSRLDAPVADQRVEDHSEDVHLLIEEVCPDGERASVFGTSASAVVALDLLGRHPERLDRVVAHEPPVVDVLPDAEAAHALFTEVRAAFRRDGAEAAAATMSAGIGDPEPPTPEETSGSTRQDNPQDAPESSGPPPIGSEALARMQANFPVFVEHVLCPFTAYVPDEAALAAVSDRLVPAVGENSGRQLTARPVRVLAERLGRELVAFPGGHVGVVEHPAAFAVMLRKVLGG